MKTKKIPKNYLPKSLSTKDYLSQKKMLKKSSDLYKKKKYYVRGKKLKSYRNKKSKHLKKVYEIYGINEVKPSKKLGKATKCKIEGLKKIEKKGQGAYYSSGSRPNQTPHSWGRARLASAITGGKSSKIDYHILNKYCEKNSKALKLAIKP